MGSLNYRIAKPEDALKIMNLHQLSSARPERDINMCKYQSVRDTIVHSNHFWLVGEAASSGDIVAAAMVMDQPQHRLCKIFRLYINPALQSVDAISTEIIQFILDYLRERGQTDVVYSTTRQFGQQQINNMGKLGFIMLGIFPNAMGADTSQINAIGAYFFNDVLLKKRVVPHSEMHPAVKPFFDLVAKQAPMPAVQTHVAGLPFTQYVPLPHLELIEAPQFVANRFAKLQEKKFLTTSFYPFQIPNVVVTSPNQDIEVFATIVRENNFAMVIGERMDINASPTEMYKSIADLLRLQGMTYVEVINDAFDGVGTQLLLDAGFIPCTYFPALKVQGKGRRDFVVFSRSFEKTRLEPATLNEIQLKFWREYLRLDNG